MSHSRPARLLLTREFRDALFEATSTAHTEIDIISAYQTLSAVEQLTSRIRRGLRRVRFLARWTAGDLVSGASDPEIFLALRERGFEFYVNPNVHAKISIVDSVGFVGSANLTAKGFGIGEVCNVEVGTVVELSSEDKACIDRLFDESVLMTDSLYYEILQFVLPLRSSANAFCPPFPDSINSKLFPAVHTLSVDDLPWCNHPELVLSALGSDERNEDIAHDFHLLKLTSGAVATDLAEAFEASDSCRWLKRQLIESEDGLFFGELSSALHTALLDDPRPSRKDVKCLVSTLITWAVTLLPRSFILDTPRHSTRIRIRREETAR